MLALLTWFAVVNRCAQAGPCPLRPMACRHPFPHRIIAPLGGGSVPGMPSGEQRSGAPVSFAPPSTDHHADRSGHGSRHTRPLAGIGFGHESAGAIVSAWTVLGTSSITSRWRSDTKWTRWVTSSPAQPEARHVLTLVLIALGILLLASAWIWNLRRAVRKRTAEIRDKNELLEQQSLELLEDRARLRTLFESSPDAMWLKDESGIYIDCNAQACQLLGLPREKIIGRSDEVLQMPSEILQRVRLIDEQVRSTGTTQGDEFLFTDTSGRTRNMELVKAPIRSADNHITGVLGLARDISMRRRAEEQLRIAAIAFESQDGIVIADADGTIQRVNTAFTDLTGYTREQAFGARLMDLVRSSLQDDDLQSRMHASIEADNPWSENVWIQPRQGVLRFVRITASGVHDDGASVRHLVITLHDLTAETEARARVRQLEQFDALTELPNRSLLEEHIRDINEDAAVRGDDSLCHGALLLIGLDDFAIPNNAHGHKLGDRILQQAAQRMQLLRTEHCMLARFSGDEFALLVRFEPQPCEPAGESALHLARILRDALAKPYRFAKVGEVICTASIGVTMLGYPTRRADTLLGQAELAMFKAKDAGKNRVRPFESQMQKEIDARNAMARDIRIGLTSNQFLLHFQPQVDADGCIVAAEALLRWKHPDRGLLSPAQFIDVAEQTGLIESLGQLVLQQACLALSAWSALPELSKLALSVNVSPRQFQQPDFVQLMTNAVAACGQNVHQLKLEITESMAMQDIGDSIAKLHSLKHLGLKLSLDDFGTGSSSLAYLTQLPIDQLKIDKSFIQRLPDARDDAHLARSILGMARGMELEVVAEGVETTAQFEFLRAHQCRFFQGYLFGKPMPLPEFERFVRASRAQDDPTR
jgi:PAS domain S-box-containing protein/diguanylate cyclase (GGDEF)-like protein